MNKTSSICSLGFAVALSLLGFASGCATHGSSARSKADEASLSLELVTPIRTLRVGQEASMELRIKGSEAEKVIRGTEGVDWSQSTIGSFTYLFEIKPQREGRFVVGPYKLRFNDRELVSNTAVLQVLPKWDGRMGTEFRVDQDTIKLGESFELTAESWQRDSTYRPIFPRFDASLFTVKPTGGSSSTFSGSDRVSTTWRRDSFLVTPKKKGPFRIDRDWFEKIPDDVAVPEIVVNVE